ncbi:glyoxylase-like metal-dependent hydrolase (beta-lactamase superfamily II) [Actinoplanes tereljensis]|uniref:Metallo-beta-lactamase domain-containing protein n=1 Tax=Paractinoplanes tereljensis TaxID=571912 RepID=A0A919NXU3_9ACTN|nr:MBL fold metallo-hydrolase [Actinoplanes tereljensis]GIF26753.1 hypothetical protein Ate02nite_94830 [Actinoplanes tereljensis]
MGGFTAAPVRDVRTFDADRILAEVPGRPEAIVVPGHTGGSTAYLFAEYGVLFTGDAVVTADGLTGRTGPTLVNRGFTQDSASARVSLDRLAQVPASLVLTGHGEPFTGSPRAAVDQARLAGQS